MSVLWMDSFDHYSSAQLAGKWDVRTHPSLTITAGRFANGLQYSATTGTVIQQLEKVFGGTSTTIFVGFAFTFTSYPLATAFMLLGEAGVTHLGLGLDSTGHLYVKLAGNGATLLTSATALNAGTWYYVELKVVVADSPGGSVQLRINAGLTENQTVSAIDTRNAGTPVIDRIQVGQVLSLGSGFNLTWNIDDLYILNNVDQSIAQPGSPANNAFLGDIRVQALFPSGNGATSDLVGSDGNSVDNYLLVNETSPNTANYVESAAVGNKDTYAYGNLTALSGTVYGVQVLPYAAKTDAGSRQIKTIARVGVTEQDGPAQTLSTTYQYLSDIRGADPTGSAWTVASVNGAEFGVKVSL